MEEKTITAICMLWAMRSDALRKAEKSIGNAELKQRMSVAADSYDQCIEELKNPPVELFKELGIKNYLG